MQTRLYLQEYLSELLKEQNSEKLSALTEKLKDLLVSSIVNHTVSELSPSFSIDERKLEAYENFLGLADNKEYQRVYYYALMKMTAEIFQEAGTRLAAQEQYHAIYRYKYMIPVLEQLSQNRMMGHKQLAEHLNISSQSLSNFFRRTKELDFWQKKRCSSSSFYVITAQGKDAYRYYQLNVSVKTNPGNAEQLLISAYSLLNQELQKQAPHSENILHLLNQKHGKGQSLFHSLELKVQINNVINNFKYLEYHEKIRVEERYTDNLIGNDEFDVATDIIRNGEIALEEGFYD
ncbi:MAG: hypothetical protein HFI29_03365 [Lachnospiraceae bacterium]|jgi:hypothetical protein|nr:hypothetical protein [Lachnospiraceae bacterium]